MTLSMTGFGKSEVTLDHFNINIEIRSLNSKFLDLSLKLPNIFKELDLPIRKLIKEKVIRGKVELMIHYEKINQSNTISLNKEKIISYHNELKEITDDLKYNSDKDLIGYALTLPEIIQHSKEILNDDSKSLVLSAVEKACKDLKKFTVEYVKCKANLAKNDKMYCQSQIFEISKFFTFLCKESKRCVV